MPIKKLYKRPIFYVPVGILVLIIAFIVFSVFKPKASKDIFVKAERGTVSEEVSVTGRVTAAQDVKLAFARGGKVVQVGKVVGDKVRAGDLLAMSNNADLVAQRNQASASLAIQQSKLDALLRGSRPEDVAITKSQYDSTQASYNQAKESFKNKIMQSYLDADNAVHNYGDSLFTNPGTVYPTVNFFQKDASLTEDVSNARTLLQYLLQDWQRQVAVVDSEDAAQVTKTKINITKVQDYLNKLAQAINSATATASTPDSTLISYRTSVASARTLISSSISALLSSEDAYKSAKSALQVSKDQLTLKESGSDPQDIKSQQASVLQAQASVAAANAEISKTIIRAPFDGTVTKQDAKLGETASANTPVVSLITNNQFQIEASIPEADISKVHVGDTADVTLDAYGNDATFPAKVVLIDPAETIIDSVATYKTTFQFVTPDDRIKSGMTANVDVKGLTHENVVVIPQRAVFISDGQKKVKVKNGENIKEVTVTTGIRGSNGKVEIILGIEEGMEVIVSSS